MTLLLDFGNTRLKWGWAEAGMLVEGGALPYPEATEVRLDALLQRDPAGRALAVSVAASANRDRIAEWVDRRWGLRLEWLQPVREAFGVINGYREPARLGADRWATLIAARALASTPACIVDCGSAATFDALAANGEHRGGMILPGLALMRRSLAQGTAALPLVDDAPVTAFARDTASAIGSGTLLGLAALIDGLAGHYLTELGQDTRLLITGGDARRLQPYLTRRFEHHPDLVLQGAAVAAGEAP